ncbi:hypothetical protein [Vreelandella sp. GE22]
MFAKLRDDYVRLRKRAVEDGVPNWALLHADMQANKALFLRKKASGIYGRDYGRAVNEMLAANNLHKAYLQRASRLERHKTPMLDELLKGKS